MSDEQVSPIAQRGGAVRMPMAANLAPLAPQMTLFKVPDMLCLMAASSCEFP
ncbi:hypothetical protein [Variovorax sp. PvP013]|uniref:hypothetical protein n=1 Tax=Variovorax sp. PvP013 TaxID=3156435 RepID=UPI003D25A680